MTVINGKKYVSEDEFEKGIVTCVGDVLNASKEADAGLAGIATSMLMMTEFAKLGAMLFEKEDEHKEE